jgi:hypothetical protein
LQGPLEIIHMFGSILTSDSPGFGCLSVTLACGDCSVVGGVAFGPLIAATPVQVQHSNVQTFELFNTLIHESVETTANCSFSL